MVVFRRMQVGRRWDHLAAAEASVTRSAAAQGSGRQGGRNLRTSAAEASGLKMAPQRLEKIDSAPGNGRPDGVAAPVFAPQGAAGAAFGGPKRSDWKWRGKGLKRLISRPEMAPLGIAPQ